MDGWMDVNGWMDGLMDRLNIYLGLSTIFHYTNKLLGIGFKLLDLVEDFVITLRARHNHYQQPL